MTTLKLTQFRADGTTSTLVIANPDNLFIQATELKTPGPHIIGETKGPRNGSAISNGVNHTFVTETPEEIYEMLMHARLFGETAPRINIKTVPREIAPD
jgi:hypothetical protein